MNTTQLILLALNCINEEREPTHTEKSRLYVFYKSEIKDKDLSIEEFILRIEELSAISLIGIQKRASAIDFVNKYLCEASNKALKRSDI